MDETEFYELHQLTDFGFRYDMAMDGRDIIDDWLNENFEEGVEFYFGETSFGTHAFTVHVIFRDIESAVAFKLRWA